MILTNIAIGIDQLFNTLIGGSPDETLSARCYRLGVKEDHVSDIAFYAMKGIDKLFFWQTEHCKKAFEAEVLRKQLPSTYKKFF